MHDSLPQTQKEKIKDIYCCCVRVQQNTQHFFKKNKRRGLQKRCIRLRAPNQQHRRPQEHFRLRVGRRLSGVILSITKPKNIVSLVESNNKKCYFFEKIKYDLALENTNIINQTMKKKHTRTV